MKTDMKEKDSHLKKNDTLRKKLIKAMLIGLIPLCAIALVFGIKSSRDNFSAQIKSISFVADNESEKVSLELKTLSSNLVSISIDNVSFMRLSNKGKEEYSYNFERYLLRLQFAELLKNRLYDTAFLYYNPKEDVSAIQFTEIRNVEAAVSQQSTRRELLSYVRKLPEMNADDFYVWHPQEIGGVNYLVYTVSHENSYLCCAVSVESILSEVSEELGDVSNDGEAAVLAGGNLLLKTKTVKKYEYAFENSSLDSLYFARIPERGVKRSLCYMKAANPDINQILLLFSDSFFFSNIIFPAIWPLLLALLLMGLVLVIVILFVNKNVIKPMERITESMETLEEEQIGEGINCDSDLIEYQQLTDTFNLLTDRMRRLRISVYEEKLQRRNAELNYYKIQIDSHFFANCLNIIMNLSIIGDTDAIEEMSRELANYIRHAFTSDALLGSFEEEVSCIRSFLHIQQIRFSNRFDFTLDIDERLRGVVIPPILLLTFVENSVKYAVAAEGRMHLKIKAELEEGNRVFVGIYDNGKGFPKEVLNALENSQPFVDELGKHIGIENAIQRMNIMYGDRKDIRIYNLPEGGAAVELRFPYSFPEK